MKRIASFLLSITIAVLYVSGITAFAEDDQVASIEEISNSEIESPEYSELFADDEVIAADTSTDDSDIEVSHTTEQTMTTNGWQRRTGLPVATDSLASAAVDNDIYIFGGHTASGISSVVRVYNTTSNTWSTKTDMTTARYGHSAAYYDGKIYIMGGYDDEDTPVSEISVYDVENDEWLSDIETPNNNTHYSADINNGYIYLCSGFENNSADKKVYKYDISTSTWESCADTPIHVYDGKALSTRTGIILLSGWEVYFYNISDNAWSKIDHIPRETYDYAAVVADVYEGDDTVYYEDGLYVFGGRSKVNGGSVTDRMAVRYTGTNDDSAEWYHDGRMIRGLAKHNMVVCGDYIYIIGGQVTYGTPEDDVFRKNVHDHIDDKSNYVDTAVYQYGSINYPYDTDTFYFIPSATAKYKVVQETPIQTNNTDYSWHVCFTDSEGNQITECDTPDNLAGVQLERSKKYYVKVSDATGSNSGNYTFRIKAIDDIPDNIDSAVQINYQEEFTSTLTDSADIDYMYVDLSEKMQYRFSLETDTDDDDSPYTTIKFTLYDSDKNEIKSFNNKYSTVGKYTLAAGRYYIRVEVLDNFDEEHYSYTVKVNGQTHSGSLIEARYDHETIKIGNDVYVAGGINDDGKRVPTIEKTSNITSSSSVKWTYVTDYDDSLYGTSICAVDSKIYFIGGFKDGTDYASVKIYDVDADEWSDGGSLKTARQNATVIVKDDYIYIMGGENVSGLLNDIEVYDCSQDCIIGTRGLPQKTTNSDGMLYNGKIYMIGGVADSGYVNNVYEFDKYSWLKKSDLSDTVEEVHSMANDDAGYLLIRNDDDEMQLLMTTDINDGWTEVSSSTLSETSIKYTDIVVVDSKVYMVGGIDSDGCSGETVVLN